MNQPPLKFIHRIQRLFGRYEKDSGGCLKFHYLLKSVYPRCNGWMDTDHVISEIDGEFYDIDGIAERTEKFIPLEPTGFEGLVSREDVV